MSPPVFTDLRLLLENESFPQTYVHKFIGLQTETFLHAVQALIAEFSGAKLIVSFRESKKKDYIAYTFSWEAISPDEIIQLIEKTGKLPDLKMIL